jgi:hypothetical protein
MAPMSTMKGRRVTILTGGNFLRTTAVETAWYSGAGTPTGRGGTGGV